MYTVMLYDGFDYEWMAVSDPVPREEADRIWLQKTNGGTQKTCYGDIDYYAIFHNGQKVAVPAPTNES